MNRDHEVEHLENHAARAYRPAAGIRWAVEMRGLAVHHPARGVFAQLEYPEAAIWDLASRGYRFPQIVELTSHIAGVSGPVADALVRETLSRWLEQGLLEEGPTDG